MIQAGKNVTAKDDPLQKIKVEYLYHKLKNPDPELEAKIRQLRIIRQLDPGKYSILKRQLPYVVCGIFNPPFRRTENFGFTEYFIVDIDHIGEKELNVPELRQRLSTDPRVMMCFLSPGEDGLKLIFRLKERCYDAGVYSVFYKLFIIRFATQYSLEQVIDSRTSDVARACFMSVDHDVYFNAEAECVDISTFINSEDTSELFRIKKQTENDTTLTATPETKLRQQSPDDEAMQQIRNLLLPNSKALTQKREAFVPEELNLLMENLIPYIENSGVKVTEVINIHYGKKLKMKMGLKESEINLFHGQRGYSVVISPRRGTNDEMNSLMAQLIEQYLIQV